MYTHRHLPSLTDAPPSLTSSSPETRLPDSLYGGADFAPEILPPNPCQEFHSDQDLADAFARLAVSSYNQPPSCPPFDFVGHGRGSGLVDSSTATNDYFRHRFSQHSIVGQMQENNLGWNNEGFASIEAMRSQNYWVGSDNWGWENFWRSCYPISEASGYSSNYDWFLQDDSRFARQKGMDTTFSTVPLSNKNELCLNSQQNPRGIYSRSRSNISEFNNINVRRPHSLRQPLSHQSVSDVRGSVLLFAKDQHGCRLLQEMMTGLKSEEVSLIISELIDHINELMVDPFGNYVFQKLVEVCTEEQRTQIVLMVSQANFQLVRICLNMHGTRAVQKLLEHVTTQYQRTIIISALVPGVVALTNDINGHHVILHCLKHFSDEHKKYLLNEVANNCFAIATDKSGCCVLQQCVNYAKGEMKDHLMSVIVHNVLDLADDCYGNYVVQHLISLKIPTVTETILRKLQGRFVSLSCNKYGSNVVEKFLLESGDECSTRIIVELLQNTNVSMLLVDPFGNYVIKSALMVSKGPARSALLKLIQLNSAMMRSNLFGKKLLARFDKGKVRDM